jgi:hypothetical protein
MREEFIRAGVDTIAANLLSQIREVVGHQGYISKHCADISEIDRQHNFVLGELILVIQFPVPTDDIPKLI